MNPRRYSAMDEAISRVDGLLRGLARTGASDRAYPAAETPDLVLSEADSGHSAGLMRVNHSGEISAQALYLSQAALARNPETRRRLQAAAAEELEHLSWCERRLDELESATSRLNPVWAGGALAIGAIAALFGDRVNLGFVEETEHQVVTHLEGHLETLPAEDLRSRAIVSTMREDEARHARSARAAGAVELPGWTKRLMALQARVMTTLAYRI